MIALRGEQIDLTLFLTQGRTLFESQTIRVKVVRQKTGVQVLAFVATVEVSPGVYSYRWTTPPNEVVNLMAVFEINGTIFEGDEVQIVALSATADVTVILGGVNAQISKLNESTVAFSESRIDVQLEQDELNIDDQNNQSLSCIIRKNEITVNLDCL